ncbi:MAG: DUF4270 domain-containing protein [Bacteroidia bacterium]|nr:DUF4270 domain-containing protein [Bacteroidia bacterium]MBT8310550.1 DUF4270 domain-containing protein [Bacteroidia bacterium]NNK27518.1 DUF4270 domain-containing protein [Flavobacteriaceae bacterium]NNL62157.1 DUF4270 domain-containing protein [Flavobacteriaceae bacterium]RZV68526.1 MAG: DUF4270 domain-containing protein [Flavobacteriaceae bacterium]
MNNMNNALKNILIGSSIIISFISCEKDFSSLGTEIIGGTNFDTGSELYDVIAYSKKVGPVRSNGLPVNLIGIYNDPVYGSTTASFITQVSSSTINPVFGDSVVLDSVVLTIPYFSTNEGNDDSGNIMYELDSIFGDSPMNLYGFRNNYFLRDFDPESGFEETQNYYSNGATSETGMLNMAEIEGDTIFKQIMFLPSNDPTIIFGAPDEETGEREESRQDPPAIRTLLDKDYWQELIIDKEGEPELSNQANFEDYFRGMYFKVESLAGEPGTMILLDFSSSSSNITLYYTRDGFSTDENGDPIREQSTFELGFNGNRVNLLENNFNFPLEDGDDINGDEKIYLKGGVGSTAVINLFNADETGQSAEFTAFKESFVETNSDGEFVRSKRLVNEANLIFYVDQTMVDGEEPDRIYLYDLTNNAPLIDYFLDPSTNNFNPVDTKILHLGALERVDDEPDGEGIKYRLKMTEHINNLLIRDSTNVKLGLSVSGNLNLENESNQLDIITEETNILNRLPVSSIISPRGTVLFGNNTMDDDKKVQLEIFYTEPNN